MSYYDTFIKATMSPKDKWHLGFQSLVDSSFENASTYREDIEEELSFGTLEFYPIIARINSLVDAKTGQRVNDDYKKLIFPNLDYQPKMGTRYKFDNNIWIIFSTDNIETDTSAVYVRRCNNVMKMQDKYGNIHEEPVYIDYKVTENQIFRNHSIDAPSGRIWFQCQLNKYTDNLNVNDRYMFGDDVYKIRERSKFDRRNTFDRDSVYTLSFYADYDNKGDNDNVELGIANYKVYNYTITSMEYISNKVDFTGKLDSTVYLEDIVVDEPVIWSSTDENIAIIDKYSGSYKFIKVGKCDFICQMLHKSDVKFRTQITVEEFTKPSFETIIVPDVRIVKLNKTVFYSIYEYLNGVQTDTTFSIKSNNVPDRNYRLNVIDGNNFSITNLKPYDVDLKVICTKNNDVQKDDTILYIKLGGIV